MFWYIVICIAMVYPLSIVHVGDLSGKKTKGVALISACMILWFFMAMRDTSVGVDTQYYSYVFTQFANIPFSEVFTAVTYATESEAWAFDFEPGYRLMNKLISYFSQSPQAITVFNSTVIIVLVYRLIKKESPNFLLSVWLYITLGVFQTEMNVTRNAIAILLVYNGFSLIKEKKLAQYLIVCAVASMFHMAALMLIPIYWVYHHFKPTMKICAWLVIGFLLVGLIFPFISPYIRMILPDSLDKYVMKKNSGLESLLVGMLNAIVFGMAYWMIGRKKRPDVFRECSLGIILLTINLCFFGINVGLDYASRVAALFGPYVIILVPQMLELIESEVRKRNAAFLMAVVCGCQYVLRLCINNIGGTMPYAFFW